MFVRLAGYVHLVGENVVSSLACCSIAVLLSPRSHPLSQMTRDAGEVAEPGQAEWRQRTHGHVFLGWRTTESGRVLGNGEGRTPGGGNILATAVRQFDHPEPLAALAIAPSNRQHLPHQRMAWVRDDDTPE
jgi:hypothetical protein